MNSASELWEHVLLPFPSVSRWCQEKKIYEDGLCMNIEMIHSKMCLAWSHSPDTIGEIWDDFSNPPPWNPTIKDVAMILSWTASFGGKLVEILRIGSFTVNSSEEPLLPQHIEFVKYLIDSFQVAEDDEDEDNDSDEWEESEEEQDSGLLPTGDAHQNEDMEIEGKKKELCMDGINMLDSVMNSGECMKEVDYLKMCNIFKGLYM